MRTVRFLIGTVIAVTSAVVWIIFATAFGGPWGWIAAFLILLLASPLV